MVKGASDYTIGKSWGTEEADREMLHLKDRDPKEWDTMTAEWQQGYEEGWEEVKGDG